MTERVLENGTIEILDSQGRVVTVVPRDEVRNYRAAQAGQRARAQAERTQESEEDLEGFASAQAAAEGAGVQTGEGQFPAEWGPLPSGPSTTFGGLGAPGTFRPPSGTPAPVGDATGWPAPTPLGMMGGTVPDWFSSLFGQRPNIVPPAAPPIAAAEGGHFDPSQFGVGAPPPPIEGPDTGLTAEEMLERAGPRPTPPVATADPALRLAQQQAAEREERMRGIFDTYQHDVEGGRSPRWLNALNIGLAPWTGGQGGVAREVDRQRQQRESIRNALLQVALAREGTTEESARAAREVLSGEHGAEQENLGRAYAEGVGARGERLGLESAADQRTFQAGLEAWREGAERGRMAYGTQQQIGLEELRIARAKRDAALAAIAGGGGRTGIDAAMAAIAGTGSPDLEAGFGQQLARAGLANWIQQQALTRGSLRAALPQIHRAFIEQGLIPTGTRAPRFTDGLTPQVLADYYARLGVPVERFAAWFPGLNQPQAAAGGR